MAPGQQASARDMVVEGAEDEEEEGLEAVTTMEAAEVAAMAMTTRTTDAVADGYKLRTPAQGQEGRGAGGGRGRGRGGHGSRGGGAANMKNGDNKSESRDDRFPGQVFFVSTQAPAALEKDDSFEEPASVGKVTLLSLVYWVPNLAANLILVRRLQKAGMDTSSKGAKTYTTRIGERVLWDLHEDRDVYNKMWQILLVPMSNERQVAASVSTMGEAVGSGYGADDGAKAKESNNSDATAKAPLDEVVMDVVGPLELGAAGAEYFLTIVDVYTRMTWVYVLSKKSDVAAMVKTDWLPMVERQQDRLVKAIRTDRGGEFLRKDFSMWLKKDSISHSLTMPYSPAMNGITEKPKVDMLRVFECMCMALVPKHLRHNKLSAKAIWADVEEKEEEVQQVSERAPTLPSRTMSAPRIRVTSQQHQGLHCAFAFFSPVEMPGEPATFKKVLESSDVEEWKKAMESELRSIEENGTWELVELPEGRKAITSKWLFKIKSDADGKIEHHKSRLVAKGYQQKEKVDYKDLFACVVKPTTLQTQLAGATIKGWVVKQMDVTTAFLNDVLEEKIFEGQPEGFDDGSVRVWKLKKALYGLKQAPRL
ncbi:unnamed protein product [Closterium sp. NIES-53]